MDNISATFCIPVEFPYLEISISYIPDFEVWIKIFLMGIFIWKKRTKDVLFIHIIYKLIMSIVNGDPFKTFWKLNKLTSIENKNIKLANLNFNY